MHLCLISILCLMSCFMCTNAQTKQNRTSAVSIERLRRIGKIAAAITSTRPDNVMRPSTPEYPENESPDPPSSAVVLSEVQSPSTSIPIAESNRRNTKAKTSDSRNNRVVFLNIGAGFACLMVILVVAWRRKQGKFITPSPSESTRATMGSQM